MKSLQLRNMTRGWFVGAFSLGWGAKSGLVKPVR